MPTSEECPSIPLGEATPCPDHKHDAVRPLRTRRFTGRRPRSALDLALRVAGHAIPEAVSDVKEQRFTREQLRPYADGIDGSLHELRDMLIGQADLEHVPTAARDPTKHP